MKVGDALRSQGVAICQQVADCLDSSGCNPQGELTTVAGSGDGSVRCSQPFTGATFKLVLLHLKGLTGTATYTFPTGFGNVPMVVSTSLSASVTIVSELAVTVTGLNTTGFIMLVGY